MDRVVVTQRIQGLKDTRSRVCGYIIEKSLRLLGPYRKHGLAKIRARSENWACSMPKDNENEPCRWIAVKRDGSALFFPFGFLQIDFSQIHEGNLFHIRI